MGGRARARYAFAAAAALGAFALSPARGADPALRAEAEFVLNRLANGDFGDPVPEGPGIPPGARVPSCRTSEVGARIVNVEEGW